LRRIEVTWSDTSPPLPRAMQDITNRETRPPASPATHAAMSSQLATNTSIVAELQADMLRVLREEGSDATISDWSARSDFARGTGGPADKQGAPVRAMGGQWLECWRRARAAFAEEERARAARRRVHSYWAELARLRAAFAADFDHRVSGAVGGRLGTITRHGVERVLASMTDRGAGVEGAWESQALDEAMAEMATAEDGLVDLPSLEAWWQMHRQHDGAAGGGGGGGGSCCWPSQEEVDAELRELWRRSVACAESGLALPPDGWATRCISAVLLGHRCTDDTGGEADRDGKQGHRAIGMAAETDGAKVTGERDEDGGHEDAEGEDLGSFLASRAGLKQIRRSQRAVEAAAGVNSGGVQVAAGGALPEVVHMGGGVPPTPPPPQAAAAAAATAGMSGPLGVTAQPNSTGSGDLDVGGQLMTPTLLGGSGGDDKTPSPPPSLTRRQLLVLSGTPPPMTEPRRHRFIATAERRSCSPTEPATPMPAPVPSTGSDGEQGVPPMSPRVGVGEAEEEEAAAAASVHHHHHHHRLAVLCTPPSVQRTLAIARCRGPDFARADGGGGASATAADDDAMDAGPAAATAWSPSQRTPPNVAQASPSSLTAPAPALASAATASVAAEEASAATEEIVNLEEAAMEEPAGSLAAAVLASPAGALPPPRLFHSTMVYGAGSGVAAELERLCGGGGGGGGGGVRGWLRGAGGRRSSLGAQAAQAALGSPALLCVYPPSADRARLEQVSG
jgi:hypothetical protein